MLWVIAIELAVVIVLLWGLITDVATMRRGLIAAGKSKEPVE